jgi:DNA-binding SARP family transcriptional activator/nucleotide-binding universal stress UspA family protein
VLDFRILGPLEVVGDQGPIRLGGPKQRATLTLLLLSANRVISVERVADELYSGDAPVTAVTQVQRQISALRRALGSASVIETRSPGYVLRLSPEQLDLNRFERQTEEAGRALGRGEAEAAADLLRGALGLWRGEPLADFAYASFAQTAIERLEEIRLAALEQRIEADLTLGRHADLVGELEALGAEHPLRERFRGQLMLALYRSGRQAEALGVYRNLRRMLVEEFGIEPTSGLHELERAILMQDPSLDLKQSASSSAARLAEPTRPLLVVPSAHDRLDGLLAIAEALAALPGRELIIARLLGNEDALADASSALTTRSASLDVPVRTAAFTSREPARDVVYLATTYDAELVLLDAPHGLDANRLPGGLAAILERSPADVGALAGAPDLGRGEGVFVPFGGGEHDWPALELGAWLSLAASLPLRLVGTKADPHRGQRDASRLLADASLAVQRVVGVEAEPLLAEPAEGVLIAAVEPATLVVVGISPRWRRDGIGSVRRALVRDAHPPILLVHGGPRPGGLAPRESRTRFTWTLDAGAG